MDIIIPNIDFLITDLNIIILANLLNNMNFTMKNTTTTTKTPTKNQTQNKTKQKRKNRKWELLVFHSFLQNLCVNLIKN